MPIEKQKHYTRSENVKKRKNRKKQIKYQEVNCFIFIEEVTSLFELMKFIAYKMLIFWKCNWNSDSSIFNDSTNCRDCYTYISITFFPFYFYFILFWKDEKNWLKWKKNHFIKFFSFFFIFFQYFSFTLHSISIIIISFHLINSYFKRGTWSNHLLCFGTCSRLLFARYQYLRLDSNIKIIMNK